MKNIIQPRILSKLSILFKTIIGKTKKVVIYHNIRNGKIGVLCNILLILLQFISS